MVSCHKLPIVNTERNASRFNVQKCSMCTVIGVSYINAMANLRGIEHEQCRDEIFRISGNAAEILVWKAEVSSDDVRAGLVDTFVQER